MIPESEWKFFEGTEQRLKHLARHRAENLIARSTGTELPWDPAEIASRQTAALQELDYPTRVETALGMDPTPEQARHLELHRRGALYALFETHPDLFPVAQDLEERWAGFRPEVNGRAASWAEVARLVREDPDRDLREAAWKAVAPFAESLREDVGELVRRRELLSRSLLQVGFPVVAFHFGEMDRAQEIGLLDMLERFTRKAFQESKSEIARVLSIHEVDPWDLEYGFSRLGELPACALRLPLAAAREQALRWGFAEDRLPLGIEAPNLPVESRPVWVEVPRETRFLYRPGSGWNHARALFRAYGAALHGAQGTTRRHFLEQDAPAVVEASGRIFEGVLDDASWLAEQTGAPAPAIEEHLRVQRGQRILELRRHAALATFENLVYAASELDPQRLYGDVLEHMLQETRRPEAVWTSHPDLVLRPAAAGAAIAGEVIAAQVRRRLGELLGPPGGWGLPWKNREVGAWLREHFMEPGARWTAEEKVVRATGQPPGMEALADELGVRFEGPTLEDGEEISDQAVADYFEGIDLGETDSDRT